MSKSRYFPPLLTLLSVYTALISSEQARSVFNTFRALWSISAQRHYLRVLTVHGSCGLMTFTQLFWKRSGRAVNFQLGSDHCISHIITSSEIYTDHRLWPPVWIIGSCFRSDEKLHKPGFIFSTFTNLCVAHMCMQAHTFSSIHKNSESLVLCHNVLTRNMFPNTEDVSHLNVLIVCVNFLFLRFWKIWCVLIHSLSYDV